MAEVRKVTPGRGGIIAAAVEKALGESVRPITPGGSPDPSAAPIPVPNAATTPITASSFLLNDPFLIVQGEEPGIDVAGEEPGIDVEGEEPDAGA